VQRVTKQKKPSSPKRFVRKIKKPNHFHGSARKIAVGLFG